MKRRVLILLAILMMALALVACGGSADEPADTAGDAVEEVATEAAEEAEEAAEEVEEEMADMGLGTPDNPIIMSFVPSGDTEEIVASGDEIAQMLSDETGLTIEANVATSYAAVVEALGAGNAHIGWLNTFGYVLANEKYGVDVSLATVRFGNPYYRGQIVVNAESGIEKLSDIQDKKMCFVDPLSTSGYIIPRITLAAAGVDLDTLDSTESGSHPNVITAVYNGDCDAGATFVDARSSIEEDNPDVTEKVLVLAESPEIPNDTVAFASGVDADVRESIVNALLKIAETDEGREALLAVYEIEEFAVVDDSFYDGFRTELDQAGIDIEELAN